MAFERDSRTWNQFRWTPRLKRLLGKVTDRDLAEIAGVHFQTVVKERRRRGIPPAVPRRKRIRWTNAMIALLGTDYDRNVAASLRLDKGSVYRKRRSLGIKPFGRSTHTDEVRWTPKMDRLLGRMPDGDVAKRLRMKRPAVRSSSSSVMPGP